MFLALLLISMLMIVCVCILNVEYSSKVLGGKIYNIIGYKTWKKLFIYLTMQQTYCMALNHYSV